MPELPEVQTLCNDLYQAGLVGATIQSADISWAPILQQIAPLTFHKEIKQKKILEISRRGKYILLTLNGGFYLIIHLRMTGRLNLVANHKPPQKHEHIVLYLNQHRSLRYHDTRKFGRWCLTKTPETFLKDLGVEPLSKEFTVQCLTNLLLQAKSKKIKPFLLDQSYIAGIGNIYADESLFLAETHPETLCKHLTPQTITLLHKAIKKVLQQGIKNMGTTLGTGETNFYSVAKRKGQNKDKLNVFRNENSPCPKCGTTIQKIVVAQRGTHFCPQCQKKHSKHTIH